MTNKEATGKNLVKVNQVFRLIVWSLKFCTAFRCWKNSFLKGWKYKFPSRKTYVVHILRTHDNALMMFAPLIVDECNVIKCLTCQDVERPPICFEFWCHLHSDNFLLIKYVRTDSFISHVRINEFDLFLTLWKVRTFFRQFFFRKNYMKKTKFLCTSTYVCIRKVTWIICSVIILGKKLISQNFVLNSIEVFTMIQRSHMYCMHHICKPCTFTFYFWYLFQFIHFMNRL